MHIAAKDIDSYIEEQPEDTRAVLNTIRHTIKRAEPEAQEVISYQMPALKFHKILVWFASFKKHYTIFFPGNVLKEFKDDLKPYELIKSGAGFKIPHGQPIPDQLITRLVQARAKEILASQQMKTSTKK
jgi:uncharacterized protein YdhG (YjbR/CyaY superfamily)